MQTVLLSPKSVLAYISFSEDFHFNATYELHWNLKLKTLFLFIVYTEMQSLW